MIIDQPRPHDVLCGKDKTYNLHHPGNRIYRDLIEAKAIDYATTSNKNAKMEFTKEIVNVMQMQYGSRFLRPVQTSCSSAFWQEISNQQARDKTSHALRFCANNATIKSNNNNKKSKAKIAKSKKSLAALDPTTNTSVVSSTRYSHPQHQQRKGHRRTVSRDSNVSAASSSHQPIVVIAHSDVAYFDHVAIFSRQQAILRNGMKFASSTNCYGDDDHYKYKQTPMADPETVSSSSCSNQDDEDLEAILSEPINEADWDDILEL
jgi:hypothetical protein